jgi:hypothetical protein
MSTAFEITEDDVQIVLSKLPIRIITPLHHLGYDTAEHVLNQVIDQGAVEEAALHGDDMDTQTQYALDEIKSQILAHIKNNHFKIHPVTKDPNTGAIDECEEDHPNIFAWSTYKRTYKLVHIKDWPNKESAQGAINDIWDTMVKDIL